MTKSSKTQSTSFQSLKPGEAKVLDGPFEWIGVKSKYFLVAALALEDPRPKFAGSIAVGGARSGGGHATPRAAVSVTLPVPSAGDFRYDVYAGPLEYRRLARIGHDLDDANPYGGFLRSVIQPVSNLVVNILLWMHEQLHLAYGWVLVIFGILVRVLLWPLNQRAMESSIRMQGAAPLIKTGPHVAGNGVQFYTGSMFPSEYTNRAFLAQRGSWNRTAKIGFRVMMVTLRAGDVPKYEPFAEGWLQGDQVWGRPVYTQLMKDGSLLIADDYAGAIYRVTYQR